MELAAKEDGGSFSAWLSSAAEKQLRVRQGMRGVAAWEGETVARFAFLHPHTPADLVREILDRMN